MSVSWMACFDADLELIVIVPVRESLSNIHSRSTDKWREQTITSSIQPLLAIFDSQITSREIRASWQCSLHPTTPSSEVMVSLQLLVQACRSLGLPSGVNTGVLKDLVEAYVERVRRMEEWKELEGEKAMQGCFDLAFLAVVGGGRVEEDVPVQKVMARVSLDVPAWSQAD